MQRFTCVSRLIPLCKYLHLEPVKRLRTGPLIAAHARRFASSASCNARPETQWRRRSRRFSRLPLATFFKRTEDVKKILQLFDTMGAWDDTQAPSALFKLGAPFHCYTVSEVIRRCKHPDTALHFFNWLKKRDDFQPDTYVYNALIYCLGKTGNLKEMNVVASVAIQEGKATVVNFTTLISAFRFAEDFDGAVRTWQHMRKLGFEPSPATYTVMIDLCASLRMYDEAGEFYFQMLKANLRPGIRTCSTLIHHLVEAGKLDAAVEIFDNLLQVKLRPNRVTYAYIVMGHAKAGDMNAVLKLIGEFKDYGHSPLRLGETFTLVLQYLVEEGRLQDAEKVMEAGWPDASIEKIREKVAEFQRGLMKGASHHADMLTEEMGFTVDDNQEDEDEDEDEDVGLQFSGDEAMSTLNVVAFVKCLVLWSSETVKALESANVKWNCCLVSQVLLRLRKAESGWKFYYWVAMQPGYCHDRYTCGMMIRILLRSGQFARVKQLLLEAQQDNLNLTLRTYASILKHCGLCKEASFSIEVFDMLKASGLTPDELCYKYFVHSLHNCKQYSKAAYICTEMQEAGFSLDETMYSFLITGSVRAGKPSIARRHTKEMREAGFKPSVAMFSALIDAFYERGRLDKAERVFKRMRQCGMMPTPRFCEQMAKILSHLGKDEEADKLRAEIKTLVTQSKKAKEVRRRWFLHFHSIFADSLKDKAKIEYDGCRAKYS